MKKTDHSMTVDRRRFLSTATGVGTLGLAAGLGLTWPHSQANAQSADGYKIIERPLSTADSSRVEVLEFFWFGCPHCYAFEPSINNWADSKPDYVNFVREAPALNRAWEPHSRTFYAAQALGIVDGMFDELFNTIHKEKRPMRDPKKIAKFVESLDLGVSREEFLKAMDSFGVNASLKRSMSKAIQAGVSGVPSIVINGKYITGNTIAGSHERIIDVINELAAKEHGIG